MRVALVSPYSWTYFGGVNQHIEALSQELVAQGHDVSVLAPSDRPDRVSALMHRGARAHDRQIDDLVVPLGRTVGYKANGAVSNLAVFPSSVLAMRRELERGRYDVVHVHEPVAPALGWDALMSTRAPLVGTFHCYSDNRLTNGIARTIGARRRLDRLRVRIAVSEAAEWTGRRFYGGRYRIIPNGVMVPAEAEAPREPDGVLRIAFVGQTVERKGLPVLLRAFAALREHVPAQLTIVGASHEEVEPLLLGEIEGIDVLGRVDDAEKQQALLGADLLVAPSLGGESFGMVLTEAFAAGRPVVASDIAGYRDVVRDGRDGMLVPRGDATALAEALRSLAIDRPKLARMSEQASERARRYAWPQVAAEVTQAYEDAIAIEEPVGARGLAVRHGVVPADGLPRVAPTRLPPLETAPAIERSPLKSAARKAAIGVAAAAALGLSAIAVDKIGIQRVGDSLFEATPIWVIVALALMCASMVVRAGAWHAILRAALPQARPRFVDALQGTMVGVLMSATLPARLGEPARAMIVARRLGSPRRYLPAVVGTLVSQTILNVLALCLLGLVVLGSVDYFDGRGGGLWLFTALPIGAVVLVLALPSLIRGERFKFVAQTRVALAQIRGGLAVFRKPVEGSVAISAQMLAWAIQLLSCYVLLVALGLSDQAGIGAAAAVLFAVNVSAVLPATPSNVGVFQLACSFVLTKGYGVSAHDALAYGVILQAVEIATAVIMGAPALLKEGLSFKEVRLGALYGSPVKLAPLPQREFEPVEAES